MTITASGARIQVAEMINHGRPIRFKYYNKAYPGTGSYYDDDLTLTQSGTDAWASGLIMPIDQTRGSMDAVLVEEGRLLSNDIKLYVLGGTKTTGIFKVGLGSPTPTNEYAIVSDGVIDYKINNESVYKKLYVRVLTNGSLAEE